MEGKYYDLINYFGVKCGLLSPLISPDTEWKIIYSLFKNENKLIDTG